MKILVDISDELSDKVYARKKLSTSEMYDLIGCVMNGAVIKDIQIGNNVFRADDLTIIEADKAGE